MQRGDEDAAGVDHGSVDPVRTVGEELATGFEGEGEIDDAPSRVPGAVGVELERGWRGTWRCVEIVALNLELSR